MLKVWAQNLEPLVNYISTAYIEYLPKLIYPIRVGEHSNSAFGMSFAYDFAKITQNEELSSIIQAKARAFFLNDQNCPIGWEPSGYDFLSPCLNEIDIMRKILPQIEFKEWLSSFLPDLEDGSIRLTPGQVGDRSDGKLVHLDGLNFSRAWCLYPLSKDFSHVNQIADDHFSYSIANITDGEYSGEHWLGSFALYALKMKSDYAQ